MRYDSIASTFPTIIPSRIKVGINKSFVNTEDYLLFINFLNPLCLVQTRKSILFTNFVTLGEILKQTLGNKFKK